VEAWKELVTTALVGTERQPFTLPQVGGPLGSLLAQLDSADQERALLSASALVALYRLAGRVVDVAPGALSAPCEPDDAPRCTPRAAQHLRLMLHKQHKELLPEWLALVASKQQRVPEELLPALLDLGRAQAGLRAAIVQVMGKRGQWLAAQNPQWEYAVPGDADTVWQAGKVSARLLLLQVLRASEPDRARELLASTWKQESPKDRAAFVATFEIGLSMADEPFLEEVLDDRRKEVRRAAADLLMCLPQSRLCQRIVQRVRGLVSIKTVGTRHAVPPRIELTLPEACDKPMVRDGIVPKPLPGKGEKAWWLTQMIGAVPLAFWTETFKLAPAVIIEAIQGDWRALLLEGWSLAAQYQRQPEWIEALLWALLDKKESVNMPRLFGALAPDRQEAFVLSVLRANPSLESNQPAHWFLPACQHAWSEELSRVVLDSVYQHLEKQNVKQLWKLKSLLIGGARYINPMLTAGIVAHLAQMTRDNSYLAQTIDEFLGILQFRQDMLEAL